MYIGMDVHKNCCQIVQMDEEGEIVEKHSIETSIKGLDELSRKVPNNAKIALEASTSGKFVYRHLKKKGLKILMAHPRSLRLIAESKDKDDWKDAIALAKLLRMNCLPESYVPSDEIESIRELIRHRVSLGQKVTIAKNQIHAILAGNGVKHGFSDLFGKNGLFYLSKLELPESSQLVLESHLRELGYYKDEIELINIRLAQIAKDDEDVELLMTIPGIDYYSALAILGEIGDISRFSEAKKLTRYSGLTPGIRQSGKITYRGRMTKEGPSILRWILTQNARVLVKMNSTKLSRQYQKLSKRIGKKKAIIAIARKLLVIIYHMLTERKSFEERNDDLIYRKTGRLRQKAKVSLRPDLLNRMDALKTKGTGFLHELADPDVCTPSRSFGAG